MEGMPRSKTLPIGFATGVDSGDHIGRVATSLFILQTSPSDGGVEVLSIVTYSQSTDPDSPHFSDMTQLFSEEGWIRFPYRIGDILRDPELETRVLRERR